MPRLLAIGDIHGCAAALDALLNAVRIGSSDRLVTLGDYVDRGPDSKGVLERIIKLHSAGLVVPLRGNHEIMMLGAARSFESFQMWCAVGGREALASYGGAIESIPNEHWAFIEHQCVDWFEADRHIFVHASLAPEFALTDQPAEALYWETVSQFTRPHCSGKIMVCGHTEQYSGWPLVLKHMICIDTHCYGGGWLTCVDVHSGRIWQANQEGATRSGYLDL